MIRLRLHLQQRNRADALWARRRDTPARLQAQFSGWTAACEEGWTPRLSLAMQCKYYYVLQLYDLHVP